MLQRGIKIIFTLAMALLLVGCASVKNPHPDDPIEGFNRGVYGFNKAVDKVILKPVAYVYKGVVPIAMQQGVGNFFDNLEEITTVANDILQLKFRYALKDTTRFVVNSTFGLGGLIDIATRVGIEQRKEDFGQTLHHWGYKSSSYLVLPFLGPSTVRDTVGRVVDRYALSIWPWIDDDEWRYGLTALNVIDTRAALLEKEKVLDTIAVDEYSFVRDAYLQRRNSLSKDALSNPTPSNSGDPFEDFDEDDFSDEDFATEGEQQE